MHWLRLVGAQNRVGWIFFMVVRCTHCYPVRGGKGWQKKKRRALQPPPRDERILSRNNAAKRTETEAPKSAVFSVFSTQCCAGAERRGVYKTCQRAHTKRPDSFTGKHSIHLSIGVKLNYSSSSSRIEETRIESGRSAQEITCLFRRSGPGFHSVCRSSCLSSHLGNKEIAYRTGYVH